MGLRLISHLLTLGSGRQQSDSGPGYPGAFRDCGGMIDEEVGVALQDKQGAK